MKDKTGRLIDYMRISITDRCNLRCVYCMPAKGVTSLGHDEILTYEEILRVAACAATLGIKKIKITGGEPLVRKGATDLIYRIKQLDGIENVTLTTNGILFAQYANELMRAGLNGVNFSLDCMDADTYQKITRADAFDTAMQAIELACRLGFKTKINCVAIRGMNAASFTELAGMAKRLSVDVRFIEMMPIGLGEGFGPVEGSEVLHQLAQAYGEPCLCDEKRGNGPAVYWDFPDFIGKIGFISTMTGNFCSGCNRVRLTSDGYFKGCLCSSEGVALKPLLRGGENDKKLEEAMRAAIDEKPGGHCLGQNDAGLETKKMFQIGG